MSIETDVKDITKEAGLAGEIFNLAKAVSEAISEILGKTREFSVTPSQKVIDFLNGLDRLQAQNPGEYSDALMVARWAVSSPTDISKPSVNQYGNTFNGFTFIYQNRLINTVEFFKLRPDLLDDYYYSKNVLVGKYGGRERLANLGTGDPSANVLNCGKYLAESVSHTTGKVFMPVGTGTNPLPIATSPVISSPLPGAPAPNASDNAKAGLGLAGLLLAGLLFA